MCLESYHLPAALCAQEGRSLVPVIFGKCDRSFLSCEHLPVIFHRPARESFGAGSCLSLYFVFIFSTLVKIPQLLANADAAIAFVVLFPPKSLQSLSPIPNTFS
jgi:hypothetical protein